MVDTEVGCSLYKNKINEDSCESFIHKRQKFLLPSFYFRPSERRLTKVVE